MFSGFYYVYFSFLLSLKLGILFLRYLLEICWSLSSVCVCLESFVLFVCSFPFSD